MPFFNAFNRRMPMQNPMPMQFQYMQPQIPQYGYGQYGNFQNNFGNFGANGVGGIDGGNNVWGGTNSTVLNEKQNMNFEKNEKNDNFSGGFNDNTKKQKYVFEKNDNKEIAEQIQVYIQNERNSGLFYKYLSEKSDSEKFEIILKKVSDGCDVIKEDFIYIYKTICGRDFECKKTPIDNKIGFADGVKWAMEEECLSIDKITDTYHNILKNYKSEEAVSDRFSILLYKKYSRFACLNFIYNVTK